MTDVIKITSENLTKTNTETYIRNNKAKENLNGKVFELLNDKGMIAPYLASSLVNFSKPEKTSQFGVLKDLKSTRMNDFWIDTRVPVTLCRNLLTLIDSNTTVKVDGHLLETMTNYDFDVSHSNPQGQKLIYEFGKEMMFIIKQKGRKSNRHKTLIKML